MSNPVDPLRKLMMPRFQSFASNVGTLMVVGIDLWMGVMVWPRPQAYVLFFVSAALLWVWVAMRISIRQRRNLLLACKDLDDLKVVTAVGIWQHLSAVVLLRNPYRLYPAPPRRGSLE